MKLFVVTSLKELLGDIAEVFKLANIDVFSTSDIIGHKEPKATNLLEDWFASGGEEADSIMIFTFTSEANAEYGLKLISDYNKNRQGNFPVRAFVLPVEKSV